MLLYVGGLLETHGYSPLFSFACVSAITIAMTALAFSGLFSFKDEQTIMKMVSTAPLVAESTGQDSICENLQRTPSIRSISSDTMHNFHTPADTPKTNNMRRKGDSRGNGKSPLYFLGLIGALTFLCEGAIGDWSVLFFTEE